MKKVPYYQGQSRDFFEKHYLQKGGSLVYFVGSPHIQHGSGILGSIFKAAVPLVKKGLRFILPEAANLGKHVIRDVIKNKSSIKKSLRKRGLEAVGNIAQTAVKKARASDIFD